MRWPTGNPYRCRPVADCSFVPRKRGGAGIARIPYREYPNSSSDDSISGWNNPWRMCQCPFRNSPFEWRPQTSPKGPNRRQSFAYNPKSQRAPSGCSCTGYSPDRRSDTCRGSSSGYEGQALPPSPQIHRGQCRRVLSPGRYDKSSGIQREG